MNSVALTASQIAVRLSLSGRVQGIGMRPAVVVFAQSLGLNGFVSNTNGGVEIHIEGPSPAVNQFVRDLPQRMPDSAEIGAIVNARAEPQGFAEFTIGRGGDVSDHAAIATQVPVDLVVCDICRREFSDATDRRCAYPFTSCTECGPRYSIIDRMPYEREQTSMIGFPLCEECRQEYESLSDRRFHAQTNACPECGPQVMLRDANNRCLSRDNDALRLAADSILDGRIIALRGLGGYQILADATSEVAIQRLRQCKRRPAKPFAVMVEDLEQADRLAWLDQCQRGLLSSPSGPIVVAAIREFAEVASSATCGVGTIGLFLPSTPLHALILNCIKRPLICTSGNVEGEPLAYEDNEALVSLQPIADLWVEHDRPIARPIDDSVVRVIAERAVSYRLARGFAPLPLALESDEPIIAVGGHQKVSIALHNGAQAVLGPHLGDMDTIAARERFVRQLDEFAELYGMRDYLLVGDRHPDYFTTGWLENQNRPFMQVQHHHAHIVAGMLGHGWLEQQVLGVAFDGTGYGDDGTIWGGEFLSCTETDYHRVGHLHPFLLPGGERCAREPWRVATTLVRDALGEADAASLPFPNEEKTRLLSVLQRPHLSPTTTSVGRLFDGVASLTLGIEHCEFEDQAAILLEAACDQAAEGWYEMPILAGPTKVLDWRPMIQQLMQERAAGTSLGAMAMRFHRGLARAIAEICHIYKPTPIVLGGGVFQNRILVELVADQISDQPIGLPGVIPPGDGGLAAGQLAIASAMVRQERSASCA